MILALFDFQKNFSNLILRHQLGWVYVTFNQILKLSSFLLILMTIIFYFTKKYNIKLFKKSNKKGKT